MDYLIKDFGKILKKNALMMRRLLLQEETDCMRVYDRNLEELPVSVDLYGKYARITDYSDEGLSQELEEVVKDVVRRMCYIQSEYVIFHKRNKRHNKEQHDVQNINSLVIEVKEFSHKFKVDLVKRIDTGLFLDHYKTRKLVESQCDNFRVLNLFSYTGSFSVYAAAGNALRVESVDLSKTYTEWAKYNLKLNGFDSDRYPCINQDALEYIIDSVRNKKKYDLIIFDPPSFSNSRKMKETFDIQRDYVRYLRLINNLLDNNGKVLFSTNLSSFHMDPGRLLEYKVKNITKEILADGFSAKKGSSKTWSLEKIKNAKLRKEDYEGKKYFTKKENPKEMGIRKKKMDNYSNGEEQNDLNKIINDLEKDFNENTNENEKNEIASEIANEINSTDSNNEGDDLVIRWDASYESPISGNRDRRPSRNDRDRNYSRNDRERSSYRDDRRSRYSRDGRDRMSSRDGRGSRYSRDDRDRRSSRDDRGSRYSRDDRDRRSSRDDRDRRSSRDDRGSRYSRDDRDRRFSRDDRGSRYSRDDRDRRFSRDDRGSRYSRDDRDRRFSRDDRGSRYSRDDRDRRSSRDDRGSRFSRDDRDRRSSREDRGSRYSRENTERKFSRDDRDRRSSFSDGKRNGFSNGWERKSFRGSDNYNTDFNSDTPREKRVKKSKPKPYGFEKKN